MRVLIVASYNKHRFAPFISEQADALRRVGCEVEFFGVEGKGIAGYLKALPALRKKIKGFRPAVVHAHYGLSGLLANMQRRVPVVTTYHGSDINVKRVLPFSKLCMILSRFNIFVSQKTLDIAGPKSRFCLLPCGVDITELQMTDKSEARALLGFEQDRRYVLFAGAFDNAVKNSPLAKEAVSLLPGVELLELKGFSRDQVTLLMCAADALLLTSFSEGSPQVVKEAMACGCPIVSVDVGDVAETAGSLPYSYITTRDSRDIAKHIHLTFDSHSKTPGRDRIIALGMDNISVAKQLISIYSSIV